MQVCQWSDSVRCEHGFGGERPPCGNVCTAAPVKEFGYEPVTHWPAGSLLVSLLTLRSFQNQQCLLLAKFVRDSGPAKEGTTAVRANNT